MTTGPINPKEAVAAARNAGLITDATLTPPALPKHIKRRYVISLEEAKRIERRFALK